MSETKFVPFSVPRSREEEVPGRADQVRDETPAAAGRVSSVVAVGHQGAGATPEREAEDADGARDAEVEGAGRGLRLGAERLEEPAETAKTGEKDQSESCY